MFIPLKDDNPLRHISFPFVTVGLIAINIFVFVFIQQMGAVGVFDLGIIPCQLLGGACANIVGEAQGGFAGQGAGTVPEMITPFSYMFLHGGWMHLGGNMLFLWVFGDNVEDAMGHAVFLLFYLLCGVFAGYTHSIMAAQSGIPLIGASGAVAGVIAAYLMLHPNVMIWVLAFGAISMNLRAIWVLGAWIILQFINVFSAGQSGTAWWAHIGGLAAGAVLVLIMRRRGVQLFQ